MGRLGRRLESSSYGVEVTNDLAWRSLGAWRHVRCRCLMAFNKKGGVLFNSLALFEFLGFKLNEGIACRMLL